MTASIDILPVWKKGASAHEWLQEVAAVALKYPERFGRAVVVFEETLPGQGVKVRTFVHGRSSVPQIVGLLHIAAANEIDEAYRR
jgi:hypothetical protein